MSHVLIHTIFEHLGSLHHGMHGSYVITWLWYSKEDAI